MRTIFEDILIAFGLKKSPLLESVEKTKRDLRDVATSGNERGRHREENKRYRTGG